MHGDMKALRVKYKTLRQARQRLSKAMEAALWQQKAQRRKEGEIWKRRDGTEWTKLNGKIVPYKGPKQEGGQQEAAAPSPRPQKAPGQKTPDSSSSLSLQGRQYVVQVDSSGAGHNWQAADLDEDEREILAAEILDGGQEEGRTKIGGVTFRWRPLQATAKRKGQGVDAAAVSRLVDVYEGSGTRLLDQPLEPLLEPLQHMGKQELLAVAQGVHIAGAQRMSAATLRDKIRHQITRRQGSALRTRTINRQGRSLEESRAYMLGLHISGLLADLENSTFQDADNIAQELSALPTSTVEALVEEVGFEPLSSKKRTVEAFRTWMHNQLFSHQRAGMM